MAPRLLRPVGWGSAAVLGLLTVVVFVLVLIPAKDAVLPTRIKYGLVFDAGSTHTSLYIYRWPADKENDTGIVSQVEACSVAGPGISSYADEPAGAGASLKPCLDRAMKIVPAEQQRETPTYLGATAGMRLLREENGTKAEQVLAEVSKAIGEYPVDFRGARILTGSEEGSFGWITVNYLLETLVKAFSGFYHSLHFLNLTGGQSLSLVNATIRKICNSSWEQVQELFPTASRTQIRDACSASSYTLILLLQGYKFNSTTWPNIHFVRQVANTDVGWTLGYMLNLTNMIPSDPPTAVTELPRSIWIAATVLLAIMLILSFCLLTATCCQRNSSGYEQL
ncbi:Ectonucleoside triphosphate diphosphohydrolase 8 [Lonchura striata]|uniref:Ectonucleoside triphosphate diphosphohydrolase 8 n=1 Tax=Lonchura striata TaxID=40157 RepID=A0A218ULN3_9PASE|nr:Ectonucleoside triphosphate diphosphohydrolase 8 [Lonchura striata domestica]